MSGDTPFLAVLRRSAGGIQRACDRNGTTQGQAAIGWSYGIDIGIRLALADPELARLLSIDIEAVILQGDPVQPLIDLLRAELRAAFEGEARS